MRNSNKRFLFGGVSDTISLNASEKPIRLLNRGGVDKVQYIFTSYALSCLKIYPDIDIGFNEG